MKTFALIALLVVAAQARHTHHSKHHHVSKHSQVQGRYVTVEEIEGAPVYPKPRIINGVTAAPGQFPYQAAIYLDGNAFCGGSLISQRWVLTAAHCASGVSSFEVYLGAVNMDARDDSVLIVETRSKIVHSSYSSLFLSNDIALLNLQQDVPLSSSIQTILLASGSDSFEGATARVSGWGKVSDASTWISPQLKYVDLSIISNNLCAQSFGSYMVRASTICGLGSGGRSACNGDSGGPLVDSSSGRQIGIVSFGSHLGCESGSPNGFARVSSFADWISQNTGIAIA